MNHVRSLGRRLGLAGVAVVLALVPMAAVPLATAQAQMATVLSDGTPDQLNFISLTCSDQAACTLPGLDLPPGATVTATLVEQVCCFPKGTPRSAAVRALVNSQPPEPTPDPDTSNNIATVVVTIVGPHGFA